MNIKKAHELQAQTLMKKMSARQFEVSYVETAEDAKEKIISYLTPNCSVAFGGSVTINKTGIKDYLAEEDGKSLHFINRDGAKNPAEKEQLQRDAFSADYFLMSTNAVTRDGELVNIDGVGNRVAALCYGPKNIIIVVSMNKIAKDVDSAIDRVRNYASPPNALRLGIDTVCTKTGFCGNCLKPDCICSQIVVTRFSRTPGRIKVVLVEEPLGY